MAGFSFLIDLHAIAGVDLVCDYRISGTVYADGQHSFDTVEVLGRGEGLSRDGWRTIRSSHPLFPAARDYLETPDAAEQARLAIYGALADEPQRPSYLIYRHQQAAE